MKIRFEHRRFKNPASLEMYHLHCEHFTTKFYGTPAGTSFFIGAGGGWGDDK
jgi:hypothetical protein